MKRLSVAVGLVLIVLGAHQLSAQQAPAAAAPKSEIIERVIVRVNGEILTQSELRQRQVDVIRDKYPSGSLPPDSVLQAQLDAITPDVLVESVNDLLLVQRGREMGAKYTDEQFKQSLEAIKKDQKMTDQQFQAALQQEGLTLEELRQQLERRSLKMAVQQREIGPSMTITQEEMRQYYQKHQDQFMTPATVTLREIFVSVPTVTVGGRETTSPADDAAARAKIDALRTRAMAGEDFVKLVNENSESSSKSIGGMVGPIKVEDISPVLTEALANLQPGQVTQPIKGPKGYQIYKLESRAVPALRPFDTVRDQIGGAIRDERLEPETRKMLAKLRTQAVIEWKDEKLREIYEKQVARP